MGYQTRFFSTLEKMYDEIENSQPDVTLHCVDDGFKKGCHRVILSIASEYFTNVFSYSKADVLEVRNGITGDILDLVLRYIYSEKIALSPDNVTDVLVAADYFNLPELVELCIPLISENLATLDLPSLVDLFSLSWKLRLPKLSEEIAPLIALSFPDVLNDRTLKSQLMSFSPKLMSLLLKSNELLLVDQETNLPSGPAEREKGVLDMILHYTSHLSSTQTYISDEDNSNLLKCAKWHLLNIFGEEEYVRDVFGNRFAFGTRKEEIQDLYNVVHNEWYLSPDSLYGDNYEDEGIFETASEMDRMVYGTRAYTCPRLFTKDLDDPKLTYSNANYKERFQVYAKESEELSGLDIFIRSAQTTNSDETAIIGGIVLHITSGNKVVSHHHGMPEEKALQVHKIRLKRGQYITGVSAMDDCYPFKFEATDKLSFGPFGGSQKLVIDANNYFDESKMVKITTNDYIDSYTMFEVSKKNNVDREPCASAMLDAVLVGIEGRPILIGDDLAILEIKFIFREFFLHSSNLLINSQKEFGRIYDFENLDRRSDSGSDHDYGDDYDHGYRSYYPDYRWLGLEQN